MSENSIPKLTDCHLHLQAFINDLEDVLARARAAGVTRFVCNGTEPADWPTVKKIAAAHPDVIPCFGLHPHFAGKHQPADWLDQLETYLADTRSAIGEIGLDKHFVKDNWPAQQQAFKAQLQLARKLERPVMIHCLHAAGPMIELLESQPPLPAGILMHAYSASAEIIPRFAKMGAYFSFGGAAVRQNAKKAHQSIQAVPSDRLLLETDSPDMPPPKRLQNTEIADPDRNEPANLPHILEQVAAIRNSQPGKLAEQIARNVENFHAGRLE